MLRRLEDIKFTLEVSQATSDPVQGTEYGRVLILHPLNFCAQFVKCEMNLICVVFQVKYHILQSDGSEWSFM